MKKEKIQKKRTEYVVGYWFYMENNHENLAKAERDIEQKKEEPRYKDIKLYQTSFSEIKPQ